MNEQTSCDFERLELLLANELPHELEQDTVNHVGGCETCRERLESLAGDQEWWAEVQTCFRQHAKSLQESWSGAGPQTEPFDDVSLRDDESFAADFAVDFLQPCEQAETLGRVADIEILEVIGRGGMGVVLKGFQRELGRYVAVKVLAAHLAASGSARKRFAREARAAAAIVHPHVMAIHSVHASNGLPYLVMPYVACESLQERLDREGPLDLPEILRIARQIAAGLGAAHAQGLVHRDVKPANILLERGVDRVMLTDFGLARAVDDASLTRTGVIAGTPQFMSPEQARGESIDARSDVFSLGSVLYTMAAGRPPFRAETSLGVLRRISDVEPRSLVEVRPDLPDWLVTIISRLHAKDCENRFPSATELAALLETCLSHVEQPTVVALPDSLLPTTQKSPSRRLKSVVARLALLGAGLALAAVLLFGAYQLSTGANGQPTTPPSESGLTDLTPPEFPWEDDIGGQLDELQRRAGALEAQAGQAWEPTLPSLQVEPQPTRSPNLESKDAP